MRRLASLALLSSLALLATASAANSSVVPHVTSCGNSFPADGHPGPWRTTNNGGTLHGNTVHVDCPSPSTHWDLTYKVQIVNPATGEVIRTEINQHRSGNGSPLDFSFSLSPYACSVFAFRTHVDNNVTGGNINKPGGGNGVTLAC